jgi:hypothetical protein
MPQSSVSNCQDREVHGRSIFSIGLLAVDLLQNSLRLSSVKGYPITSLGWIVGDPDNGQADLELFGR